jgi:hypothetical protein
LPLGFSEIDLGSVAQVLECRHLVILLLCWRRWQGLNWN